MKMETNELFEYAARKKLRFPYKGLITVEDLWDLPVDALDGIYKTLNSQVKQTQEESLLKRKTAEDVVLSAKVDLIRYIVAVKLAEAEERQQAVLKKQKKDKLLAILAEKQDQSLMNKSEKELQKMLDELED